MTHRPTCQRVLFAALLFGLSGCIGTADPALPPIPLARVDMDRMYGGWYLIATIRNGFEKGMVAPYDVYSKRPDGDIREDFTMRRGSFQARPRHFVVHDWVRPGTHNGAWRVQLFWPVNLPFLVLGVDPAQGSGLYQFAMFGEQNRKLGWIYARTPTISDSDYARLLARFKTLGYNPVVFVKFIQTPAQIGQPGFWSDGITATPLKG